jgi:hypothetical protein
MLCRCYLRLQIFRRFSAFARDHQNDSSFQRTTNRADITPLFVAPHGVAYPLVVGLWQHGFRHIERFALPAFGRIGRVNKSHQQPNLEIAAGHHGATYLGARV